MKSLKSLSRLDLSHDEIGDYGVGQVITGLDTNNVNLDELDLSGNGIGKDTTSSSHVSKYMPVFIHYLLQCPRLMTLKLGFNNLRGSSAGYVDQLLNCFAEMGVLKHLDLQHNVLGQNYGPQKDRRPPVICILSDVLIKTHSLKTLNISHNEMERKSALSIAHGLSHTLVLQSIDVSGNPIGQFGMRLLLQSMNNN